MFMSSNAFTNAVELFSAPIEALIVSLGKGIAEAQTALDRNSIQTQEAIDADPVLASLGLQATWYQFPRVDLEIKLAITVVEERTTPATSGPVFNDIRNIKNFLAVPRRLVAQPVSAAYQNHFNYNSQAASTITLSIVPVPPPGAGDQSIVQPGLSANEVEALALNSPAPFATILDAKNQKVPHPGRRFDVNFNAAARLWYVLQYDPADTAIKAVVVTVDDVTKSVRVISS
jgi:hypothetical protein